MASKADLIALLRECRKVVNDNATWPKHNLLVQHIDAALAPEAGETVRVRIAVAVDANGWWNAVGSSNDKNDARLKERVSPNDNEDPWEIVWVEASLPLPVSKTVEGECV